MGSRTQVDFTLREETQQVDAVVVTALGIKRSEKALSYNVQQVDSESLLANKDANFINSLNGKVAGVTINAPRRVSAVPRRSSCAVRSRSCSRRTRST